MKKKKILIIASVVLLFAAVVYFGTPNTSTPTTDVAADFTNAERITTIDYTIPEDVAARFTQQLAEARELQQTEKNPFSAHLTEATLLAELGQWEEALEKYEWINKRYPDDYLPYMNKGSLLADMQQYRDAAVAYQSAINKKPQEPLVHLKLAEHFRSYANDPLGAEAVFERALVDTKNHKEIQRAYAVFLEEEKQDYAGAIALWEQVLEATPDTERANAIHAKIQQLELLLR